MFLALFFIGSMEERTQNTRDRMACNGPAGRHRRRRIRQCRRRIDDWPLVRVAARGAFRWCSPTRSEGARPSTRSPSTTAATASVSRPSSGACSPSRPTSSTSSTTLTRRPWPTCEEVGRDTRCRQQYRSHQGGGQWGHYQTCNFVDDAYACFGTMTEYSLTLRTAASRAIYDFVAYSTTASSPPPWPIGLHLVARRKCQGTFMVSLTLPKDRTMNGPRSATCHPQRRKPCVQLCAQPPPPGSGITCRSSRRIRCHQLGQPVS